MYSGEPDGADATSLIKNSDRLKYILGEAGSYEYMVASRSMFVYSGVADFNVAFNVASVFEGAAGSDDQYYSLCYSTSNSSLNHEDYGLRGIRPIVVLPSDIEVEKKIVKITQLS